MEDFIGPNLPPGLREQDRDTDKNLIGPTDGPAAAICGPMLPSPEEIKTIKAVESSCMYGPQLPPDITTAPRTSSYGPALPPGFQRQPSPDDAEDDVIGPQPLPARHKVSVSMATMNEMVELERTKLAIESRSKATKDQLTGKVRPGEPEAVKREEWMTELPPEMKPSGIGARKFRKTNFDPGDRSVWTDTPADRVRKAQEVQKDKKKKKGSDSEGSVSIRDKELEERVVAHNKTHRSQSLMEMHRKRRAEEQNDKGEERRPFDRETDLEVPRNLVTPAKRQALMKDSAKALSNKFARGKQAFL